MCITCRAISTSIPPFFVPWSEQWRCWEADGQNKNKFSTKFAFHRRMRLIFLFLPTFLLSLHTIFASGTDKAPTNYPEFAALGENAELVGPSIRQVQKDLRGYSEWGYQRVVFRKRSAIRLTTKRGSTTLLRQKRFWKSSRQVHGTEITQNASKWTTDKGNFISTRINLPDVNRTINEIVLLTASGDSNTELFRIVWRWNSWGYHDSLFVLTSPDDSDNKYWYVYHLGEKLLDEDTKIYVSVENNKLSVEWNNNKKGEWNEVGKLWWCQSVFCNWNSYIRE